MSHPNTQISFEQAGLGTILSRNRLVLPPNQRDYAWEERHVKQLLVDFAKAISDDGKGYFLGTIVTIPRSDGILEVVDGQQRLATTSILLAAIRDYLADKDQMTVDAINNSFLSSIDLRQRLRVPNLRLNDNDHELFAALLTQGSTKPAATKASHRRMIGAYTAALAQVQKVVAPHDPKHHADVLIKWVTFIENGALAILVRVADGANAYRMFETLNDRGLKTSQADLIKSFLFEKSGRRLSEIQTRWASMRGILEGLGEKDYTVTFLLHALIVQRGQVRESAVYETVQLMATNEDNAVTCASALASLANAYVATFNPEHEKWNGYPDKVRRSIEVFNLIAPKPLRPLILAIAEKFDKKETNLSFQFLVSFSVRLMISGGTTSGSLDTASADASLAIFKGNIKTQTALKKALADVIPSDARFKEAVIVAKVSQSKFARYYLRSLEMTSKGESEPYFMPTDDRSIINLEHVLPKDPMGNWPQFTPEQFELYINRLGNQTLMRASENSEVKSGAFAQKKQLYANSTYNLTKQIAEFSDWTVSAIDQRQRALADLALKTWPV